ncbi:uncharacterized protein BX664DRAFT_363189 [Halteromyces radiatus]|uniref:uncharacterized protein n=1 Tax=Halteromyces radiatus TaxID=101107 RepID=UPI002220523A|nr:uncharacterized protein BX664DRAFT_363189 [Halteromyces radiatus]KAI8099000.1 hypothetical protein BX664DRAFT_363189 [Halteromyces radiatus]
MTGRAIPAALPDNIRNEICTAIQTLQSKPTIQTQPTGITPNQQPQTTGLPTSSSSLVPLPQPQRSASTSMLNNLAGGTSLYTQQQPSSVQTGNNLQIPMMTGYTPTPGASYQQQVPMPTGMQGNNLAFANQMMPNFSVNQQHHYERLAGKVKIPWAVTTEEKKQYSKIFKAWDSEKQGFLTGDKAKEIFTQSGLPQNVLMQIWNLSDPNNQGKLNVDEFSVAMHLIYRKLNGYNVPTTLPPELIPPSTRELKDTVDSLKDSILKNIAQKKSVTSFSASPTSLSVPSSFANQRSRSVSPGPTHRRNGKKKDQYAADDDDDDDVGYVSSARRMGPDRSRWNSSSDGTSSPKTSSYGYRGKATRIAELRKQIGDCKASLKKMDEESKQKVPKKFDELSYLEQQDINEIKSKVRELQQEITRSGANGNKTTWETYIDKTSELSNLAEQEKSLMSEVRYMIDDTLHGLLKQVDETEDDLKAKKIQKAKADQAKAQGEPIVPDNIQGTGPNGEVTEADRIRAKAKALIAAKMGKITGQTGGSATKETTAEAIRKAEEEREEFQLYCDSIRQSIRELEDAVKEVGMETSLIGLDIGKHKQDQKVIDERNRFEYGYKVATDLKEFVDLLAFETAAAQAPDVDPSFESRFPEFEL